MSLDIITKPTDNCDSFSEVYDHCLRELVDKHAPTETRVVRRPSSRSAPWYNHECRLVKSTTRRLEKIDRTTHTATAYRQWRHQSIVQRTVFQRAHADYWNAVVNKCPDSRSLWRKVGALLQHVATPVGEHSATLFATFFCNKVDSIRGTTMNAPKPTIHHRELSSFGRFQEITADEVFEILRTASNKQCIIDSAPTWLVKQMGDVLAPVFTDMINRSFEQGCFPSSQKEAIIGPRLKKQSLDPADLKSY